tara:strand:- start:161 stop:319 length:159 start_codon:yes stop_codon:yes gene_type:complete
MNEGIKEIEMYYYIVNGKQLWTSNELFAHIRANYYGTENVYIEKISTLDLTN